MDNFKNNRVIICIIGAVALSSLTAVSAMSSYAPQPLEPVIADVAQEPATELAQAVDTGVRVERETVDVNVPYQETRRASSTLNAGEEVVVKPGSNGLRKETYEITYRDGVKESRVLVDTETVKAAVNRVVETGGASAVLASRGDAERYKKVITATATGYCACATCGTGTGNTATGLKAQRGVIAVDPKVIPLGSRVYIESENGTYVYGTAVAADTGGAIKGNKVDLCFNTHAEALQFGRRSVKVYVE